MQSSPRYELSKSRRAAHYAGLLLGTVGLLLFLSTFLSAALDFGDFTDFEARGRSMALRAVGGFILMILGGLLSHVGRLGAAGAGIVPDPQQARADIEPWARAAGGVLGDALEELDRPRAAPPVDDPAAPAAVRVRCRACRTLNDETAKFCGRCGAEL